MRLALTPGHPRLYLTAPELPRFRLLARTTRRRYRDDLLGRLEPLLVSEAALRDKIGFMPEHLALAIGEAWRITGDSRYGLAGRWLLNSLEFTAHNHSTGYDTWGVVAEAAAILYDWLHDYWQATQFEEQAARVALYCARRALDESLRVFIVDDWHNYSLGLQAGALAGALAVGYDHPRLEDGTLLRTMHAFHFTGLPSQETFLQDAFHMPKTVRCLEATLRSGNGSGFAAHLEASGPYHTVDSWELIKFAEWWTSALRPATRKNALVWPEVALTGESILHFNRPDGINFGWGDTILQGAHTRQANVLLHLQARSPRPHFASWLAQHSDVAREPYPIQLLLRAEAPARGSQRVDPPVTSVHYDPLTIMRSSWRPDATMVTFRCGRHAGGHNHFDHNSFTIFRKGALAVDSGPLSYTSPLRTEYQIRTIAHNAILVRDPTEPHWLGKYALPTTNDGGQRLATVSYAPPNALTGGPHPVMTDERARRLADEFDMGHTITFVPGKSLDYVAGDATRAYTYPWSGLGDNPSRRVEEAVRQLVFLKPDLVVVFDRVEATRKSYEKTWLLHTMRAPRGAGRLKPGVHTLPTKGPYSFAQDGGRLTVWPMLPEARRVRVIGGAGFEHWLEHSAEGGSRNYPGPSQRDTGAWRLEITPQTAALRDCFLTVLHAGLARDRTAAKRFRSAVQHDGDHVVLTIERKRGRAWSLCATLRLRSSGPVTIDYDVDGERGQHHAPAPVRVPRARS